MPTSPVYDSGMPRATMCASCRDLNLPFSASCRGQAEPKQQALGHVDVPSLFSPACGHGATHNNKKERARPLSPASLPFCRLHPPPPKAWFHLLTSFPRTSSFPPLFQFSELPNGGERRQQLEDTQCVRTYVRTYVGREGRGNTAALTFDRKYPVSRQSGGGGKGDEKPVSSSSFPFSLSSTQ